MPIYQRKVRKGSIMSNGFVMITGASSGIGKAFAAQFAKKGYDLILVARRKERLQELAEEWTKKGRKCFVLTADLAKKKECRKIMDEVEKLPVKVFINNAGFGDPFRKLFFRIQNFQFLIQMIKFCLYLIFLTGMHH